MHKDTHKRKHESALRGTELTCYVKKTVKETMKERKRKIRKENTCMCVGIHIQKLAYVLVCYHLKYVKRNKQHMGDKKKIRNT